MKRNRKYKRLYTQCGTENVCITTGVMTAIINLWTELWTSNVADVIIIVNYYHKILYFLTTNITKTSKDRESSLPAVILITTLSNESGNLWFLVATAQTHPWHTWELPSPNFDAYPRHFICSLLCFGEGLAFESVFPL